MISAFAKKKYIRMNFVFSYSRYALRILNFTLKLGPLL